MKLLSRRGVSILCVLVVVDIVIISILYPHLRLQVYVNTSNRQVRETLIDTIPARTSYPHRPTYVISISYPGQQGSAVQCLSTLQCFLSSIYEHFYVVEPYFVNSRMQSYTLPGKPWMTFSSFFNLDFFNNESRKAGYAEISRLEDFQKVSSDYKYIIYASIDHSSGASRQVLWSANASRSNPCLGKEEGLALMLELSESIRVRRGIEELKFGKCIVRVIKLAVQEFICKELMSNPQAIVDMPNSTVSSVFNFIFGTWSPQDVLLVFSAWRKNFLPVSQPLNGVNCLKNTKTTTYTKSQFQPSERLLHDAEVYEKKFLGNANRLAIMLRVERVIKYYLKEVQVEHRPNSVQECLQNALASKSKIENGTQSINPLVTLDIGGKFGSETYKNETIEALSAKVLESLYDNRWSIQQWENSFVEATGGETHPGYIAALQRLLASRADCMVLMGGGDFQALAVQDYMEHHTGKRCIYLVCCMALDGEVQRTIWSFEEL